MSEHLNDDERESLAYAALLDVNDDVMIGLTAIVEAIVRDHLADRAPNVAVIKAETLRSAADEITAARNRGGYIDHQTAAHIDRWLRDRADALTTAPETRRVPPTDC